MRKVLLLSAMLMMSLCLFAQEVTTLTFTAKCQNESYQKLDSIVVTNLDREWSDVLYYPDTLLLINTVGITDYESQNGKVKLYQNIPNPFHGVTNFNLTLFNKEKVELIIFDINGRKVAEYHNTLPSGEHQFRAVLNTPQTYLLSAVTKNGNTSIKMINVSNSGEPCHIEYLSSMPLSSDFVKKETTNEFVKGDKMQYTGYATHRDGVKNAEITQNQYDSETITFVFPNEVEPEVSVTTEDATDIDTNTALLSGAYTVKYTEVLEAGFAYKTAVDSDYTMVQCSESTTPFSLKLTGLASGTTYDYKAYVKTSDTMTFYGESKSFTTTKVLVLDVQTILVSNISNNSAQVTSKLTTNDDLADLKFGVRVYNQELKFDSLYLSTGINDGIFYTEITNLLKGTHYFAQAYAMSADKEAFGEALEFNTLNIFACGNALADYEGNSYATVQIGSQCWMAEDMRCKVYADGTPIASGYHLYTDNASMGPLAYYDFAAATRSVENTDITKSLQGICPDGWHIPSYTDFNTLCKAVDNQFSGPAERLSSNKNIECKSNARLAIKLSYPDFWVIPSTGPVANTPSSYKTSKEDFNASGFAGIARGYKKGSNVSCPGSAHYWTSVGTPEGRCDVFKIVANSTGIYYQSYEGSGKELYGVRCVMDSIAEQPQLPIVESGNAVAYANSANVNATLVSTGGGQMLDLGFCYGKNFNPSIEKDKVVKITNMAVGEFSANITDLENATTYYVRPYAVNSTGIAYGNNIEIKTSTLTAPEVMTVSLTDSTQTTVLAKGKLLVSGGDPSLEIGFVYSDVAQEPTLSHNHVTATMIKDNIFDATIVNLRSATTYYVRAYAKNTIGTSYGVTMTFHTTSGFTCGELLQDVEKHSYKTVKIGKQCWMQENLRVNSKPDGSALPSSGYYNYTDTKYGLGENTYYTWETATLLTQANKDENAVIQGICPEGWHIPAYNDYKELCLYIDPKITYVSLPSDASTAGQTVTSTDKLCIKLCKPHANWSLASGSPTEGTPAWATAHNDPDLNASEFSALPFGYWSKDTKTLAIGPGNQAGFLTSNNVVSEPNYARTFGVKPAQTGIMHERANGHKWSVRCIMNAEASLPDVKTLAADLDIFDNLGARLNGQIISTGHTQIKESGFFYGTDANPIANGQKVTSADATVLQYDLPKLNPGTTYYYVAFATSQAGTGYGEILSFTTRETGMAPTVESIEANAAATYVNVTANLKSNGGEVITDLGFCYGTSTNPTLGKAMSKSVTNFKLGEYSMTISELAPATKYYVRPYAVNLVDTAYGENMEFTTRNLTLPAVKSIRLSDTSSVSVTALGQLTNDGGDDKTEYGFVYSDAVKEPTLAHQSVMTTDLYADSTFQALISSLTPATTYYVRAYAKNSIGTVYGDVLSFSTSFACGAKITDIDGNTYNTVQIGNQCWMKENLRTSKYSNGTDINLGSSSSSNTPMRYEPNGKSANVKEYGYLYNWSAATANANAELVQGICPDGWHLPTDSNWTELMSCVGSFSNNVCGGLSENIAKALATTEKWNTSTITCAIGNESADNDATGFSALPAGIRNAKEFSGFGAMTAFISATSQNTNVLAFTLMADSATAKLAPMDKSNGFSVRCISDELYITKRLPTTVTTPVTSVQNTEVRLGGNVYDDGESDVTAKGICWSTSPHPTINGTHTNNGTGLGTYTTTLSGLEPATIYYARAYATNYLGVSYGNEIIFMTANANDGSACAGAATVSDYDNNVYETVQIGGQCWMREHLKTTHYSDGTLIALTADSMSFTKPYCYEPRGASQYVASQGYLYNWAAVMHNEESSTEVPSGVQGICPNGWHVPSDGEWTLLTDYMSSQSKYACNSSKPRAMAKSLASDDDSWAAAMNLVCAIGIDISSNNLSGFNAKSAGGFYGGASGGGMMVSMWSSSAENETNAYFRSMRYYYAYVTKDRHSKDNGFSVRCVMNK